MPIASRTCLCLVMGACATAWAAGRPNDPLYAQGMQPNLDRIGMPAAWEWLAQHPPQRSAVVAVLDTGIAAGHPDLDPGRVLAGYDFVLRRPGAADPGMGAAAWHGLHASGLIAAATGNGKGIAAVAGGVKLLPVRVLGPDGHATEADIADAIHWAAGQADVIHLGFSAPGGSLLVQRAVDDAIAAGAIVVAGAGDHDPGQDDAPGALFDAGSYSPGGLDQVITVGAAAEPGIPGSDGARAAFSNYGARVDLLAPGQNVFSTFRDVGAPAEAAPFTYHALSGSAQAAAQVSAAAALVRSVAQLRQGAMVLLLRASANPAAQCPAARHPGCGAGLLDVGKLLQLASQQASCGCPADQACLDGKTCVSAQGLHRSRYGGADVAGGCAATGRGAGAPIWVLVLVLALLGRRRWLAAALLVAAPAQAKVAGLDSSYAVPTDAQLAAARAAGVRLWMGYLPLPGAAHGWAESDFQRIKAAGLDTLAFAFGTADPVQARQMAAAWGVRLCLDVEDPPRGDGAWVDGWLAASGAGLYGNKPILLHHRAPFAIMAAYPGYDPGTNDPGLGLGVPTGWQWQGTHDEFGASVDRGWYDDWFASSVPPPDHPPQGAMDANCQDVWGQAVDPDTPGQAISVQITFNGGPGVTVSANGPNHGFSLPMPRSLLDGQPQGIHAVGLDSMGGPGAELQNSPKTVQCAPPALPHGVRRWVPSQAALQAWKFDPFWDLLHYPAGPVEGLPLGPELPAQPRVVQADGAQEVWVLDGAVRRHVPDPAALSAWRFGAPARVLAAQLAAYPEGPAWREAPWLAQGAGPPVYVVDDDPGGPAPDPGAGGAMPDGSRIDVGGGCQAGRRAPPPGLFWLGLLLPVILRRWTSQRAPAWAPRSMPAASTAWSNCTPTTPASATRPTAGAATTSPTWP